MYLGLSRNFTVKNLKNGVKDKACTDPIHPFTIDPVSPRQRESFLC
jgi:hypothetical protein